MVITLSLTQLKVCLQQKRKPLIPMNSQQLSDRLYNQNKYQLKGCQKIYCTCLLFWDFLSAFTIEKILNTCRPKMATHSAKDIRRWHPRRLESTLLFLISINIAWLLNEFSSKQSTAKKKAPKANITLREPQHSNKGKQCPFCPPT